MKSFKFALASLAMSLAGAALALPVPVATWNFANTLNADGAAPALVAIDPLGLNAFVTDTVFGNSQIVYQFNGNRRPSEQAGLSLNTTGLLTHGNAYTVDMTFKFNADNGSWKEIFGVSNRTSDNSLYIEPGNHLQVYPVGGGPNTFTFGEYHRVSLTNNGAGHLVAYMDGVFQFDLVSDVLDFNTYGGANPERLIHFFADNVVGGGQGEFASGSVAQIRLFDKELTRDDVRNKVPEPASYLLVGLALAGMGVVRRARK
ncbi:PEP-CTERM sorting domain-containing protein [Paucibacter soli]|uniref:PEP-CTERM sorting domain-containing protein n=1 Tax=Paucibacter soli TaxID=3133433 RepID=UPI003097E2B3